MKSEKVKKILVIRFSSLGDVLLTSALLKSIKENFPEAEVHYLTKQNFAEVIRFNPNVNKIIEVDNDIDFAALRKFKAELKSDGYDLIIDAHNSLRSFYLKLFLNAGKLTFKKYSFRKFLLVKFMINLMKDLPSVTVRYCNIIPQNKYIYSLPEIQTDDISKSNIEKLLRGLNLSENKKLICIAPSSAHFTKTYPAEYYIQLINKFDSDKYTFLLIGKGKDRDNISKIKSQTGTNVIDLCDKLSVLELAELIKKCSVFICGDTGPMHIAEAVNTKLIMIAGSSVKEFGFYPQNENAVVLENNNLKCRPCSHIGRNECPMGHFKCMKEITPQTVYDAALKLLN